jgi:hypothetical protein
MSRRRRALSVACSALLAVAGCEESSGEPARVASAPPDVSTPAGLVGQLQARTLDLPAGRSSARFEITALAPSRHTWDMRVSAPAEADVGVWIRTWYGQRLRVLDSTRDRSSCRLAASRSVCSLAFPRLEAQRPGAWTVFVAKRSTQSAQVRVSLVFNAE